MEKRDLSIVLGKNLTLLRWRVAVAESCTGGQLAAAITAVAGSSRYFDRGYVVYSNSAKQADLGVKREILEFYGAVSIETAKEMAVGVVRNSQVELALSITGIAGPTGGTVDKPIGLVYFGWVREGVVGGCREEFRGGRGEIQHQAVVWALRKLVGLSC